MRFHLNLSSTCESGESSKDKKFIVLAVHNSRQYAVMIASNKIASAFPVVTSGIVSHGASPNNNFPPQDSMVAAETPEASRMRCAANRVDVDAVVPRCREGECWTASRVARQSSQLRTARRSRTPVRHPEEAYQGTKAADVTPPADAARFKIARPKPAGTNSAIRTSPSRIAFIASAPPRPDQVANLEPAGERRQSSALIQPQIRWRLAMPQSPIRCSVIGRSSRGPA